MSSPGIIESIIDLIPVRESTSVNADSYREMKEIVSIMRGVNASIVEVNKGQFRITYKENVFMPISVLRNRIAKAKEQAKKNIAIVDAHVNRAKRDINIAKQAANVDASKYERMYEEEIARLEALKEKASQEIKSPYGSFDCKDEIKRIDNMIDDLKRHKKNIQGEKAQYLKDLANYEKAIDRIAVAADIKGAEAKRPEMSFSVKTHLNDARSLNNEITQKIERGKRFAEELIKIDQIIKDKHLEKYNIRFVEKVKKLDPFAPNAIEEIEKLLQIIYDDEKYLEAQSKSEAQSLEDEKQVLKDLQALKDIAEKLKAVIISSHEAEELADFKEKNEKLLDELTALIYTIRDLDYLSPQNEAKIKKILLDLEDQKSDIKSSRFTGTLDDYIAELKALRSEAELENQKYQEFMEELTEYNNLISILSPEEHEEDIDLYGSLVFDPRNADEQLEKIKDANKFLRRSLQDIQSRVYIGSVVSILEEEKESRVFNKEMNDEGASVHFVDKDNVGVLYEIKTEEGKTAIAARGVILHNGKKLVSVDKLKEECNSCRWHEDLEDKMVELGLCRFSHVTKDPEAVEAYYQNEEECYYRLSSYEESYRYLKLFNLSDEEIKKIIGEEEGAKEEQQQEVSQDDNKEQELSKHKEIKEGV